MLICIVGMDGSGKSTLAGGLVRALEARGVRARYTYGRYQPRALAVVFKLLGGRVLRRASGYGGYARSRRRLLASRGLRWGYALALGAEYLLQVVWRVRLPLLLGRTLVCDRYYIDTVVADLALDAPDPERTLAGLLRVYRRLLPRPAATFMLDVPAEVACERKADIPALEYAQGLRRLYLLAAASEGATVLDGTRPAAELLAEVMGELERKEIQV